MIGTMRKHSTWLWSIIIIVVIFAFVIWGTGPSSPSGGPSGNFGRINGQPVSEEDVVAARNEVTLLYFMRFGEWPDAGAERRGFDLQTEIYTLLLRIQQLNQRKMVAGTEAKAVVAESILNSLRSQGFNSLAQFETEVLARRGLSLADVDRAIEHQIAMRQLTAVEGLPGKLITPGQVESLWKRENEQIKAGAVFFSASNHLDSVDVTPGALAEYFTNQMARYRIPERLQVSYVAYPVSNYLAAADNRLAGIADLDARVDTVYRERGTNFYAGVTPEQAREQIREELREDAARFEAQQAAAAFADTLWQQEPMQASDLERLAAQQGLTARVSEPFARDETPSGLDVDSRFVQAAFRLRPDEPFAGPVPGDAHFYVFSIQQRIPSRNATLDEVKDRVTADYTLQQATVQAREAGQAFASRLSDSLAAGQSFSNVCAEAGYEPRQLPPFARGTRSLPAVEEHTALGLFKQVAFDTPPGQASRFTYSSDGGYVVYVESLLPIDEARMQAELPHYTHMARQTLAAEAFNFWFSQMAQVALRETPLNQAPPPQLATPEG